MKDFKEIDELRAQLSAAQEKIKILHTECNHFEGEYLEACKELSAFEHRHQKLRNVLQIIAAYNMEATVEVMNYHKRIAEQALAADIEKEMT